MVTCRARIANFVGHPFQGHLKKDSLLHQNQYMLKNSKTKGYFFRALKPSQMALRKWSPFLSISGCRGDYCQESVWAITLGLEKVYDAAENAGR